MTQAEYEQKKRECWEEFKVLNSTTLETTKQAFDWIWNRAYALGKVKDLISQDEIDKAAEDYVSFEKGGKCYPNYIIERACCRAFKDGANFALGKQKKDVESSKGKLMCLRDRTKVCNRCHACGIDADAWHSMYSRLKEQ